MCLPSPSPVPKYYLKTGNVATKNSERQSVKGTDLGSYDLTNAKRDELTYLTVFLLPFNQLFCFAFFFSYLASDMRQPDPEHRREVVTHS